MTGIRGLLSTRRIALVGVVLAVAIAAMGAAASPAIAAIGYVGVGSATGVWAEGASGGGNPVSIVLPVPSGNIGDLLICQVNFRGGSTGTTSTAFAGWTGLNRTNSGNADGQVIYYRIATAASEGPYTWTYTDSANRSRAVGNIIRYRGVDATSGLKFTANSGTISPSTATSLTTTVANTVIVAFHGNYNTTAIGTSSPMTSRYAYTAAANGPSIRSFDQTITTPTGTGDRTATCGTGGWVAQLVALKPASTVTTITVTASASNKTYDATNTASVTCTATGIAPGDSVTITYTPPATFNNRNAGTGKLVTVSGLSLTGASASKYVLSSTTATTTANITKKRLDIYAVADTKIYDGSNTSSGTPTVTGLEGTDSVTGRVQIFDSKNVGALRVINPSEYAINDGNNGNNYEVYLNNALGSILAKALSINAVTNTKIYDGGVSSAAAPTVTGLVVGDSAVATQTYDTKNVGTDKTLSVSEYTVSDGNNGDNYSVSTDTDATGVINARELTITVVADTKPYDGNLSSDGVPTVVGLAAGDSVAATQTYTTSSVGTAKTLIVADYEITDGNDGLNYAPVNLESDDIGVITAKELTVSGAVADDKVYDGSTDATVTFAAASLVGIVDSEDVTLDSSGYSADFDTKDIGTDKDVTVAGLALGGTAKGNYTVAQPVLKADITALELTVSGAVADDKVYDGSTDATVTFTAASLVGIVDSEDVTLDSSGYSAD
ncbi:MAG: YDG domain-containing protein, partial [Actinomycetes bacterium]